MSREVIFSICHTTARPEGWQDSYRAWIDRAAHPENVEYILCVDERWGFTELPGRAWDARPGEMRRGIDQSIWNTGRRCLVDGANIAASRAFGKVLIINSDDMFPQQDWDVELLKVIPDLDEDFVVRTSPGAPYQAWLDAFVQQGSDLIISRLMTLQILSRVRYQRFGYALYPEFTSMMADTDFTDAAECDGSVIEARHILIEHRHPFVTGAAQDDVSKHENEAAAHALGARIYARRAAERRGGTVAQMPVAKPRLVVFLTGSNFPGKFMISWTALLVRLSQKYDVYVQWTECSNQYYVRDLGVRKIREDFKGKPQPDYALFMDYDNILSPEAFDHLAQPVELPGSIVHACAGWYWMPVEPPQLCARVKDSDGIVRSVTFEELQAAYDNLKLIELTDHVGFGSIFMRWEVVATAGEWPFCAIVDNEEDRPMKGDDVSFCRRALDRGYRFYLHPEVYLPHLKLQEIQGPKLRAREGRTLANAAD